MATRSSSGRTTAKGTIPSRSGVRYTPPQPKAKKHSPLWVPVAMFTMLVCGVVVIVLNYLGMLPGGDAQNSDLVLGLVLIVGGFIASTQYH
jgi:hypothetical protein